MAKKRVVNSNSTADAFMNLRYLFSKLMVFFAYLSVVVSVVYLFVGYGDESVTFWTFISALWVLSILLFHISERFDPYCC